MVSNIPIFNMFHGYEDFISYIDACNNSDRLWIYKAMNRYIANPLFINDVIPEIKQKVWNFLTFDDSYTMCIYAPMNNLDKVVVYFCNRNIVDNFSGIGERWNLPSGMAMMASFRELISSLEYRDNYIRFGLNLLIEGNLRKYSNIFSNFFIPDHEKIILELAEKNNIDLIFIRKRIKAAKLLIRS